MMGFLRNQKLIGDKLGRLKLIDGADKLFQLEKTYVQYIKIFSSLSKMIKEFLHSSKPFGKKPKSSTEEGSKGLGISDMISLMKICDIHGNHFAALSNIQTNFKNEVKTIILEKLSAVKKVEISKVEKSIKKVENAVTEFISFKNKKDKINEAEMAKSKIEAEKPQLLEQLISTNKVFEETHKNILKDFTGLILKFHQSSIDEIKKTSTETDRYLDEFSQKPTESAISELPHSPAKLEQDESEQGEFKQDESKQSESKLDDSKQGESKQDESKQGESKQDESKQGELKQDESKQGESKQDESKQGESKQDESKQGESEQVEKSPEKGTTNDQSEAVVVKDNKDTKLNETDVKTSDKIDDDQLELVEKTAL